MSTIRPGDKVRDTITGFTGIAVCRSEWLNGPARIAVQGSSLKDGLPSDKAQHFDEPQLDVVKQGAVRPRKLVMRSKRWLSNLWTKVRRRVIKGG